MPWTSVAYPGVTFEFCGVGYEARDQILRVRFSTSFLGVIEHIPEDQRYRDQWICAAREPPTTRKSHWVQTKRSRYSIPPQRSRDRELLAVMQNGDVFAGRDGQRRANFLVPACNRGSSLGYEGR